MFSKSFIKKILPLCGLTIFLTALASCLPNNWQKSEGIIWNTSYHITFQGPQELKDSIFSVLESVGTSLSIFDPNSIVSRVNIQDSTLVDDNFIKVYTMSRKISAISEGMFDPTVSPIVTAWGFGPGHKASSDTLRIDSLLHFVGINKTHLHSNSLIKSDRRIEFNFSAIAKGYACDAIGEMLKRNGVKNFLIEIGGEIYASGNNPENKKWKISVDKPIFSNDSIINESQTIIDFTDLGMATSGNYRNFHIYNGSRFGHTISPLSGRPIETDILSATVIAPSAMEADGLATAFMSMGSKKSIVLANRLNYPVMFVLASGEVYSSHSFKKLIAK